MEDQEVGELLSAWGLKDYIEKFKENAITSLAFPLLSPDDIVQLFPVLGHRIIFKRNWEEWCKVMHPATEKGISFELSQLLDMDNSINKTASEGTSHEIVYNIVSADNVNVQNQADLDDLQNVLQNTLEGRGILNCDKGQVLTLTQRNLLVKIICQHVLKDNPTQLITNIIYRKWAQEIVNLFPLEKKAVYFHTKFVESTAGVINRSAGKLPDQIHNLRRRYRESGLIKRRERSKPTSRSSSLSVDSFDLLPENDDESVQESLLWLENSTNPWSAVEKKWRETFHKRQQQLHSNPGLTINEYLKKFPALKTATGFHLVNSDFELFYPEKTGKLADLFPILKLKLFELAQKRKSKNQTLTSMISKKNSPENTSNAAALLLIPLLLSVATIPLKSNKENKRSWRPSKAEIQEGFITVLRTDTDLNQVVDERRAKFQNFGLTLQPFVIIVATDLEHIQSHYAVVDGVFYSASNVLNAVDICFKIFWAFNAQYPAECKSTWLFIEKAVYEIDSPKQSTASNTLLTELGYNM